MWFGGTLPLASAPIWGLEGWWASQGGHSAGQCSRAHLSPSSNADHGVQPPQEQLDSRSVTVQPSKATMDEGWYVVPSCWLPCDSSACKWNCTCAAAVLACAAPGEPGCSSLLEERLLLKPFMCLWPGLTWALGIAGI